MFLVKERHITVEYEYLRLPPRCMRCNKWGHSESVCLLAKPSSPRLRSTTALGTAHIDHLASTEPSPLRAGTISQAQPVTTLVTTPPQPLVAQPAHTDTMEPVTQVLNPVAVYSPPPVIVLEEGELAQEGKWSLVPSTSAGKSNRHSPGSLVYGQVKIASPSRYAVLSTFGDEDSQGISKEAIIYDAVSFPELLTNAESATTLASHSGQVTLDTSQEDQEALTLRPKLHRSGKKQVNRQAAGKNKFQELLPGAKPKRSSRKT